MGCITEGTDILIMNRCQLRETLLPRLCEECKPTDNSTVYDSCQESDKCIFIRCPPPSDEILRVAFQPSKKISELKSEIQAQLGLHPTDYILQISGKWTMITRDGCSFADYNIHKHATLDIKLLQG